MIRLLFRWYLLGLVMSLTGAAPAAAQFALRADTFPVNDIGGVPGELHGIVQDDRGAPLPGAFVSALGSTSAFAVSDREGRYSVRNLPPGTYLVRVYLEGYAPARPRSVQVVPDGRTISTVALSPRAGDEAPAVLSAGFGSVGEPETGTDSRAAAESQDPREVAWRLRHARRSVLKDAQAVPVGNRDAVDAFGSGSPGVAAALMSGIADLPLSGQVNFLTTTTFDRPQDLFSADADMPRPIAYLSLVTPAAGGEWAFRGAMTQGDLASWILAGSFVRRAGGQHTYEAGLSYSMQRYQGGNADALAALRDGSRNAGALYAYDTWTLTPRVTVSYGGRLAEYDYLDADRVLVSPQAAVVIRPLPGDSLRLRASGIHRESAPGADEFLAPATGVALPPERTFSPIGGEGFRPERLAHLEFGAERQWQGDLTIGVRAFHQRVRDQMVTLFGEGVRNAPPSIGHYFVGSGGSFEAGGWGVSISRPVGDSIHASLDYTQVETTWLGWSADAPRLAELASSLLRTADRIHDLTASMQTVLAPTSTRVLVLYKLNSAFAGRTADAPAAPGARFNLQVTQSLPLSFLAASGAQWEMLVAVTNLFRDELSGSVYDELLVLRPPTRVLGGVTVRF